MNDRVTALIDSWQEKRFDPHYFLGDPRFPYRPEDYHTRGYRLSNPQHRKPDVTFETDKIEYGIILQTAMEIGINDIAGALFTADDSIVDCLKIAGVYRRFKEVSPVAWSTGLLRELVDLAREVEVKAIHLIPSSLCPQETRKDGEKLYKIYDLNAEIFGFKYSRDLARHVLELESKAL